MTIRVLSEQLASQIAAGEVVERPASAVKEMVENAIDAGATTINIDIRQGGRAAIKIADNGRGISTNQVETAFLRHATSKITSADQLESIQTLGFRGEALAAIAAVSQLTIVTRTRDAGAGVRLVLDGGHRVSMESVGAPQGTVISVEKLFFNVPARLKFLKTVATEKRLIDEFVTKCAMAYPDIRFRLTHDGRINFQSPGNGNLRDVLVAVYGADIARDLLPVGDEEADLTLAESGRSVQVAGYAGPPSLHRANRNHITLFVNGRWIKDRNLTYAVVQAYHTLLPIGRYPLAVIFVSMPFDMVDVNVHPTKTEVRFREPGRIFGAIQKSVRSVLIEDTPVRHISTTHFESLTQPTGWEGRSNQGFTAGSDDDLWRRVASHQSADPAAPMPNYPREMGQLDFGVQPQMGLDLPRSPVVPPSMPEQPARSLAGERLPIMRVVGQVGSSYIITEGPEGLFLIDQHAAHERIQYENYLAAHEKKEIPSQGLMAGTAIHLSPDQATLLQDHIPILEGLGFQIEPFGPNAFMVRAIPAVVAHQDPTRVMMDIIADFERGDRPMQQKVEDKIIRRVCKTASIKAGQTLSRVEMEELIQQLEQCHSPHTCPHGRPTLIYLSVAQLAKEFGR